MPLESPGRSVSPDDSEATCPSSDSGPSRSSVIDPLVLDRRLSSIAGLRRSGSPAILPTTLSAPALPRPVFRRGRAFADGRFLASVAENINDNTLTTEVLPEENVRLAAAAAAAATAVNSKAQQPEAATLSRDARSKDIRFQIPAITTSASSSGRSSLDNIQTNNFLNEGGGGGGRGGNAGWKLAKGTRAIEAATNRLVGAHMRMQTNDHTPHNPSKISWGIESLTSIRPLTPAPADDPNDTDGHDPCPWSSMQPPSSSSSSVLPSSSRHAGILSTLLRLYHNPESRPLTPLAPATPLPSPAITPCPSPSQSRRSSLNLTRSIFKGGPIAAADLSSRLADRLQKKTKGQGHHHRDKGTERSCKIRRQIAAIMSRHRYLLALCRALMLYGAPTHRLEEYMVMSARALQVDAQFLYMPGCMLVSFDDRETHTTEFKLVRAPQLLDLGRLRDVHSICKAVVHDRLGADEAISRLEAVVERPDRYPAWLRVVFFGLASATVAPFAFEGRLIDMPAAFALGCVVGTLQLVVAPRNELLSHVLEFMSAAITSFLARALGSVRGGELFCFSAIAQSSIALILPGYLVLCASLELQSRNLMAGSVRMVYAVVYTLLLGCGITIGASLYGAMDKHATSGTHCRSPLEARFHVFFVMAFTLCLCIINHARWAQTPLMLVMALVGWAANAHIGGHVGGKGQVATMVGAMAVGLLANAYSRLGSRIERLLDSLKRWWTSRPGWKMRTKKKTRNSKGAEAEGAGAREEAARKEDVDLELGLSSSSSSPLPPLSTKVGAHGFAAAAMLPAILVLVPSGLAATGSLLSGITSANQITGDEVGAETMKSIGTNEVGGGTALNMLFNVIEVAIGISVGLFASVCIVYPSGKRRSGLFSL